MKRIISIVLSVAMLMTLLSITASATAITSISVEFDPRVGAEVPDSVSATRNQGTTSSASCYIECMFTGDAIAAFTQANIDSLEKIDDFCEAHSPLDDASVYGEHEYLFVFAVMVSEDTVTAPTITPTGNVTTGKPLFIDDSTLYFYFTFTPQAAASNNNPNTNIGNNNSGTGTGSPSTPNSKTTEDIDVKATYIPSSDETTIYSVVIEWDTMEFTYNSEFVGTWNPGTHDYDGHEDAYWTCEPGANAITVTNHSNAPIAATFSFNAKEGFNGVNGNFSTQNTNETVFITAQTIATAVGTEYTTAPFFEAYLMLSGDLPKDTTGTVTCGTVTVTIS